MHTPFTSSPAPRSDIILPEGLHNNVRMLAAAAANTKRHGAPFRHMLFYGPPGACMGQGRTPQ